MRLRLSAVGESLLRGVDSDRWPWEAAVGALSPGEAVLTSAALESVLRSLQRGRSGRSFGVCATCTHFTRLGTRSFRCGLTGESLSKSDSTKEPGSTRFPRRTPISGKSRRPCVRRRQKSLRIHDFLVMVCPDQGISAGEEELTRCIRMSSPAGSERPPAVSDGVAKSVRLQTTVHHGAVIGAATSRDGKAYASKDLILERTRLRSRRLGTSFAIPFDGADPDCWRYGSGVESVF